MPHSESELNSIALFNLCSGTFDKSSPGERPDNSLLRRASNVKSYLSDAEGLGERLETKERELLELKKVNAIKGQDVRNANFKVRGLYSKYLLCNYKC